MRTIKDASHLFSLLLDLYGERGWWPLLSRAGNGGFDGEGYHPGTYPVPELPRERFEIAVGAILTQNTSWRNVCLALRALHSRGLIDPVRILAVEEEELAALIRPSGYFRQKAARLKEFSRFWIENPAPGRGELLSVRGIGAETADSILVYAFGVPSVIIDTYTRRILERLGRTAGGDGEIREYLAPAAREMNRFHALFVEHAKQRCRKRDPLCGECGLSPYCATGAVRV